MLLCILFSGRESMLCKIKFGLSVILRRDMQMPPLSLLATLCLLRNSLATNMPQFLPARWTWVEPVGGLFFRFEDGLGGGVFKHGIFHFLCVSGDFFLTEMGLVFFSVRRCIYHRCLELGSIFLTIIFL